MAIKDENYTSEISTVSNAVANMKRQSAAITKASQMRIREYGGPAAVQTSFAKALDSLQRTTVVIASNLSKLAVATTRTIHSSIAQYSRAISEDININKQNLVATALAQSTPIFGYFVAKFMETNVFKKLREKVSDMFSGLATKAKEFVFRKREAPKPEKTITIPKPQAKEIPKLQKGGLVEKSGLVKVHAGEVVAPIQDVLKRVDESISTTRRLARMTQLAQLRATAEMGAYVKTADVKTKRGIISGFVKAYEDVQKQYEEPANIRLLRAVLAIQETIGASIGKWKQIWARMLLDHPVLRNIVYSLRMMKKVVGLPFKVAYMLTRARGGYNRDLSHSRNPFTAIAENIGALYVGSMWRLDNIALYTKATAEAVRDLSSFVTGYSYPSIPGMKQGTWSIFGIFKSGLKFALSKVFSLTGKGASFLENLLGRRSTIGPFLSQVSEFIKKEHKLPIPALTTKAKRSRFYERGIGETGATYGSIVSPVTGIMPISEIHIQRMYDEWRNQFGYTKQLLDVSRRDLVVSKRLEKHQKGFLSNLFAKVITFLPMLGSLLTKSIFSVFKFTKLSLIPSLLRQLPKLFSLTFLRQLPKLMISVLPKMLPLIAKASAVATAGIIGWKFGKKLDEWLGISKKFRAFLEREDKKASELTKTTSKTLHEQVITAKTKAGTTEAFTAKEKVALQTQLGKFAKERRKDVGFFGRSNLLAIEAAQEKFMQEHINEYLEYGASQVEQLRAQWLKEGGYKGKFIGTSAIEYGRQREKAFLDYLKRKGKPLSAFEKGKQIFSYKLKYKTKEISDKYSELVDYLKKTSPEAKEHLKQLFTHGKSIAQTKVLEVIERLKKTSPEVKAYLAQLASQGKSAAEPRVPELIERLKKTSPEVREYLEKLARQGKLTSQAKLSELTERFSKDLPAFKTYLKRLDVQSESWRQSKYSKTIEQLNKDLLETETYLKKLVTKGKSTVEPRVPEVIERLKKTSPEVREYLEKLARQGKLTSQAKVSELIGYSGRDLSKTETYLKKLVTKGKSAAEPKVPELIERLKKTSPEVREYLSQLTAKSESIAQTKVPELIEHLNRDVPEIKVYLKKLADQVISQSKPVIEEIKGQNKVLKELSKESTQTVSQGIHRSTSIISQNFNNVTTVLQASNRKLQRLTNETYDIIYGRLSQNRPLY